MKIQWPEGLSSALFVQEYWQKKPLLIRQAFPDFTNPIDPDELAGLACDEEIPSRLITHNSPANWVCEHGPFNRTRLQNLPESHWSLLVSDIEKHLPDFQQYIEPFRFIADWRIDDLMISLAPPGGSVGPHVDRYDVFLLQTHGQRLWKTSSTSMSHSEFITGLELQILKDFTWDTEAILNPGDMLYLPPGIAHHGIAIDMCMTWSIGFRTPTVEHMIMAFFDTVVEQIGSEALFQDYQRPDQHPGEITESTLQRARDIVSETVSRSLQESDSWFGSLVTESTVSNESDNADLSSAQLFEHLRKGGIMERNSHSKFAFIGYAEMTTLFVDGVEYPCDPALAKLLCRRADFTFSELHHYEMDKEANALFDSLIHRGALLFIH